MIRSPEKSLRQKQCSVYMDSMSAGCFVYAYKEILIDDQLAITKSQYLATILKALIGIVLWDRIPSPFE